YGSVEEGSVREPARPVPTPNLEVARLQPLDSADRPVDAVNTVHRRERHADVTMHCPDAITAGSFKHNLGTLASNVRHGRHPDSAGAESSPTAPQGDRSQDRTMPPVGATPMRCPSRPARRNDFGTGRPPRAEAVKLATRDGAGPHCTAGHDGLL